MVWGQAVQSYHSYPKPPSPGVVKQPRTSHIAYNYLAFLHNRQKSHLVFDQCMAGELNQERQTTSTCYHKTSSKYQLAWIHYYNQPVEIIGDVCYTQRSCLQSKIQMYTVLEEAPHIHLPYMYASPTKAGGKHLFLQGIMGSYHYFGIDLISEVLLNIGQPLQKCNNNNDWHKQSVCTYLFHLRLLLSQKGQRLLISCVNKLPHFFVY